MITTSSILKHRNCRVLCVDDNRDSADTEALLLQIFGFDTKVCYDGESALSTARSYLPNVCIIDLNMPGMDGDELAKRLRDESKATPPIFVALTAMNGEESRRRINEAGFQTHLVKPVDPEKFIRVIEGFCRESIN